MKTRVMPLAPVDWGGGDLRDVTLLEVTSPEGITGLGSAYSSPGPLERALTLYRQDPEALHTPCAEMTVPMSAIDIALWDIRGKEENQPVSELLGGRKRDRILAYATAILPMTSAESGDEFERILRSIVEKGFRAIKLSIDNFGHRNNSRTDREWDRREAALLRFARKIVGKDIPLMLDVYGSDPEWSGD